jgi:hypothetical protein
MRYLVYVLCGSGKEVASGIKSGYCLAEEPSISARLTGCKLPNIFFMLFHLNNKNSDY